MKPITILYILLTLHSFVLLSQENTKLNSKAYLSKGEVSGRVIDSKTKNPMQYVTVALYKEKDSSLVTGQITDSNGEFIIKNISVGNYYIVFSFIGYKSETKNNLLITPINSSLDFNNVVLYPNQEILESVDVVVNKPNVSYEIDKKIVNVENMNTVASETAIEVLENIPSITVDADGNVSLRGSSGFTLLIDNKPSPLEASDALQLIPAGNIKDIEIITNPSARYSAEGVSGIINIILKKNKLDGISTLININTATFGNYGSDFLVNINKSKFKLNFGGNYKKRNRFRDITQERLISYNNNTSKVYSNGIHRFFSTNYGLNTALEWTPNRKNFFYLGIKGDQRQFNAAANYDFTEHMNNYLMNTYSNKERTLRKFFGLSVSSSYEHLIKGNKDHNINITAVYTLRDGLEDALTESFDVNNYKAKGNQSTETGPSERYRIDLTYKKKLKNDSKLEFGTRGDFGKNKDYQNSYELNTTSNSYLHLPLFSSDVNYTQNIYAIYGIFSGKKGSKLGYQFGLRSEYTDRLIYMKKLNSETKIKRLDLFPSSHFSYKLDKSNNIKLSASRRIQRPRSWNLEPFIFWEDPYTVRQGNPNLLSEYIQSYEIGWIRNKKNSSISSEIYYRNNINSIERIKEVYDTNVTIKRPVNAGKSKSIGVEISYRNNITKRWTLNIGTNSFYYNVNGVISNEKFDRQSLSYNFRIVNAFDLKNNWKTQVITKYTSPIVTTQGKTNGFFTADLSLKKDFLQNKLSCSFQFRNIIQSMKRESWIETNTLQSYRKEIPLWPEIAISIAVRLNNYNNKDKIKTIQGEEF